MWKRGRHEWCSAGVSGLSSEAHQSVLFFFRRAAFFGAGSVRFPALTDSLKVFPAVKAGALEAGRSSSAPVAGFLPFRAARDRFSKDPKPTSRTVFPEMTWSIMVLITAMQQRVLKNWSRLCWGSGLFLAAMLTCDNSCIGCRLCIEGSLFDHDIYKGCLGNGRVRLADCCPSRHASDTSCQGLLTPSELHGHRTAVCKSRSCAASITEEGSHGSASRHTSMPEGW